MLLIAFFTDTGKPQTGLSPTIDVWEPDGSKVVNSQTMIEIAGGFYKYDFVAYNGNKDYSIRSDGGVSLSINDRYTYATNELNVNIGGGLGITGDMIFELKKLADNIITKKDLEKFLEELSKKISSIKQKAVPIETIDELIETISKVEGKIDFLMKNNTSDNASLLKQGLKDISAEILSHKKELIKSTTEISNSIKEFQEESKNLIEDKIMIVMKSLSAMKQRIMDLDKKTLSKFSEETKKIMDNFSSISKSESQNISKFESDRKKSFSELITKFQEITKITELSHSILNKFNTSDLKLQSIETSNNSHNEKNYEFFKQINLKHENIIKNLNSLLQETKEDKNKEVLNSMKNESTQLLKNMDELSTELKLSTDDNKSFMNKNNSENLERLNSLNELISEIKKVFENIDLFKSFAEIKSDLSTLRIELGRFEKIIKNIKRPSSGDDLSEVESQINSLNK